MAKYVPPSKRLGYVPSAPPPDSIRGATTSARGGRGARSQASYDSSQLVEHFTHSPDSTLAFFSYHAPLTPPYERPAYEPTRTPYNTPLPPAAPSPPPRHPLGGLVSFIRIFPGAHPVWVTHRELWVHTSAHKLLADHAGAKLNFGRPIPLFDGDREWFVFNGYWVIDDLLVVAPQSDELRRMLSFKDEQRAYRGGRTADAWRQALEQTWVRLKLSPAPPTGAQYDSLRPIMDVPGGIDGGVEAYMLGLGGLDAQVQILEDNRQERRTVCEKAGLGGAQQSNDNDK